MQTLGPAHFTKLLLEHLDPRLWSIVDPAINKTLQNFRLPHTHIYFRRIYTKEEIKEHRRENCRRYYNAHNAKCHLSTKKSKLHAKGVVKWPDIDLTPKPRGRPLVYTKEEAQQHKRDYYKRYFYIRSFLK